MSLVEALEVALGEIAFFAKKYRPAAARRIARDAATVDAAADDRKIEWRRAAAARNRRHRPPEAQGRGEISAFPFDKRIWNENNETSKRKYQSTKINRAAHRPPRSASPGAPLDRARDAASTSSGGSSRNRQRARSAGGVKRTRVIRDTMLCAARSPRADTSRPFQ